MSSLSYSGGSFTSKLSWSSERDRACFSHMQAITQRLSVGGEVGYAMKDKQPVGCTYRHRAVPIPSPITAGTKAAAWLTRPLLSATRRVGGRPLCHSEGGRR